MNGGDPGDGDRWAPVTPCGGWTAERLVEAQPALAAASPEPWEASAGEAREVGGCFVCFASDDRGWAAATVVAGGRLRRSALAAGTAGGPYLPGLLFLREGTLLETAVRSLVRPPEVLLVNAAGRDHPCRAGLALHLGALLGLPTVGVTNRPLLAAGPPPGPERGASAPLRLDGEVVGAWVRTRPGARPLAVHAAWRTDPATAIAVVMAVVGTARTPEPLRHARRLAREARAGR